jgi:hypothetical protein
MIETETVPVLLIARTVTADGPVVDVFTDEVVYATGGVVTGHDRGEWWESLPVDAATGTATLAEIDTTITAAGYTRTTEWRGPRTTSYGVRWVAEATTTIEPLGEITRTPSTHTESK